jgi:hypothetical protein
MGMTQSHSAMLKRYCKESIFEAKLADRSYIWKNVEKKDDWAGGVYEVPVKKNGFSSVQFASLPSASGIAEAAEEMGTINAQKELIMSAIFNERDLARHSYSDQTYIDKILEMADDLPQRAAEQMEAALLRGSGVLSKASADGDVSGNITVPNPELYQPQMKVTIDDDNSSPVSGYVRSVDINTGVLVIYDARSGGSVVDLSGYTTAQNAVVQIVGASTECFLDLKTALLPASVTGGSATIYGLTKANNVNLQAKYASGSGYTATTILKDLLKEYTANRKLGRGNITEIWVSTGAFANACANLESLRQYMVKDKDAGYGFQSITLVGAEGQVKIVGLNSIPNDLAVFVDWSAIKFVGQKLKKKMYGDAGLEYFAVRNTTGIQFITDMVLAGDFVINPGKLGIVHSIPSSVST